MRKHVIYAAICICFLTNISNSQELRRPIDSSQDIYYGVSTLKGVKEVFPYVNLQIIEPNPRVKLQYTSEIGNLVRDEIQELVVQALEKTGVTIATKSDRSSENAPLNLETTIMIKIAPDDPPIYHIFIHTEALQRIRLERNNAIQAFSRVWPTTPKSLYTQNILVLNSSKLEDSVKEEVAKQIDYFIHDFNMANPKPVTRSAEGVDIEALRKTLFTTKSESGAEIRVRGKDNPQLLAIKELEMAGSEEAINVLFDCLTDDKMNSTLKQNALTALGRIGTEPAIEAIKKFERWSQKRYISPAQFHMGPQAGPANYGKGTPAIPIAQTTDSNNKTYALVPLSPYGSLEIFLTSQIDNEIWSKPILLDLPGFPQLRFNIETGWNIKGALSIEGDLVKIECLDKSYEIKISEQIKDTDKDGFPDIVEARLSTNPKNPDSDGDGLPDSKDSNPLIAKHKEINETTEIFQAVFSIMFATSNSHDIMFVVDRDEFAKQEYYGYPGPIILTPSAIDGFLNLTSLKYKYKSEDEAILTVSDHIGSLAGSVYEVKLKKILGKWVVVELKTTMIR
ncbi:MAG: HEAT repeat domain-containing protein [Sedimentisphaerales bacterium]|nr:HEAT repeat domain-containing protein [Sedimentisphaerales bacterium]